LEYVGHIRDLACPAYVFNFVDAEAHGHEIAMPGRVIHVAAATA
jgi:hypothetical protein